MEILLLQNQSGVCNFLSPSDLFGFPHLLQCLQTHRHRRPRSSLRLLADYHRRSLAAKSAAWNADAAYQSTAVKDVALFLALTFPLGLTQLQ